MTNPSGTGARHRRREHVLRDASIVLVRARYPENLGAVARALRVTGFQRLILVDPQPLASTTHSQARALAVGSTHILDDAKIVESVPEAITGCAVVLGTSARHGLAGVRTPRQVAPEILEVGARGGRIALLFGGEREGLRRTDLSLCTHRVRIPMVANEPSLNLAQAVMILLYELMVCAFERDTSPLQT